MSSFSPDPWWIQRWFPSKWSEVVGNSRLVEFWMNAILHGICNALFTGPNRTGKTRVNILGVRAMLCTNRTPSLDPCGECHTCKSVGEAESPHFGIYASANFSKYSFHPINCGTVNLEEIQELRHEGDLYSENTIVYLDEVGALRPRRLEGQFLKLIDETPATWIASAITLKRKKGSRKGEWKDRLSKEMKGRFAMKIGTSVPNESDLYQWIVNRCHDWNLTIHDPEVTIPLMISRTEKRVGYVIHMLAYAASRDNRDLGHDDVKRFNLDTTD